MRRMISKILKSYGIPAKVTHGEASVETRIFFQPGTSRSWQRMESSVGPLGEIPGGQYLYIGPAEQEIAIGDQVEVGGESFVIRRAEHYRDQNGPVYWWGLCVEKGGEDTWGSRA